MILRLAWLEHPHHPSSSLTPQELFSGLSQHLPALTARPGANPHCPPAPVGSSGMPTLLFEPDDLGVGAEAVPGGAVVNGLEISPDDVADGQCGDDALVRADRLHRVAPGGPGLQDVLLPGPRLPSESGVSLGRVCPLSGTHHAPQGATHDAVRRRGAADEALDLPFLAVQGMLRLGAGDDGGTCEREERAAGTSRCKTRCWEEVTISDCHQPASGWGDTAAGKTLGIPSAGFSCAVWMPKKPSVATKGSPRARRG